MNVLVTGGKGFIGSHLVKKAASLGHNVTVISRSMTVPNNLVDVVFTNVIGSYSDEDLLNQVLPHIDIVIHLAWTSVPRLDINEIDEDIANNINGSIKLLNACVLHKIKKFIFISSGGTVYGLNQTTLLTEEQPLNPLSYYGIGKVCIENYLRMYEYIYGLNYCIFRVSNAYGQQQNFKKGQGVLGIWLNSILHTKHIEVWGDGSIVRDYIHVNDVVNVLSNSITFQNKYKVYNLGSGVGISLNQIISLIRNNIVHDFTVEYRESRRIDIPSCILNISKIQSDTGFKPSVSFLNGMEDLWSWVKNNEKY